MIDNIEKIKEIVSKPLISDSDINRVDIYVFHHSLTPREDTKECVSGLIDHSDWPYKITILDTSQYIKGQMGKMCNKIINESSCPYTASVCSDVVFNEEWLKKMMDVFLSRKDVACVTPLITPPVNKELDMKYKTGIYKIGAGALSTSVCVYNNDALKSIGMFDERFYLYGHDADVLRRLEDKGYSFFVNTDVIVTHKIGTTTKKLFNSEEMEVIEEYNKQL